VDPGPRPLGALEVITAHTGPATDPDGYTLMLNSIGLAGVAAHCDNGGANPCGVRIDGGRTSRVIFQVKCPPPLRS
jgi:hypothetical protein